MSKFFLFSLFGLFSLNANGENFFIEDDYLNSTILVYSWCFENRVMTERDHQIVVQERCEKACIEIYDQVRDLLIARAECR